MLIHTSNYVPFNMWQSGTLSLWLTGKSVGSVENLSNDSDLKWLCRETIMNEDCTARLCLLSSASSGVCVSFCWNVLKVCSLSFLSVSPPKQEKHMQIEKFHQVSLEMARFTPSLSSANLHRVKISEIQTKQVIFSCDLFSVLTQSLDNFTVRICKIWCQRSDYHLFHWINSILLIFTLTATT